MFVVRFLSCLLDIVVLGNDLFFELFVVGIVVDIDGLHDSFTVGETDGHMVCSFLNCRRLSGLLLVCWFDRC